MRLVMSLLFDVAAMVLIASTFFVEDDMMKFSMGLFGALCHIISNQYSIAENQRALSKMLNSRR